MAPLVAREISPEIYQPPKLGVVLSVVFPHLVDYIAVVLNFPGEVARVPVAARIVEAEPEFHAVFVGKGQEHVEQVARRHVAAFAKQILRGVGYEFAVARANHDHRVDAHGLHVLEIALPFLRPPVLVRYVVRYFIEERSGDFKPCAGRHDEAGVGCGGRRRLSGSLCRQIGRATQKSSRRGECRSLQKVATIDVHDWFEVFTTQRYVQKFNLPKKLLNFFIINEFYIKIVFDMRLFIPLSMFYNKS